MTEHNWKVYADSGGNPILIDGSKSKLNDRLKHIYSEGRRPGSKAIPESDFTVGTWYVECKSCGFKTKTINGKPLIWGNYLDCDYTFAIYGISKIMNS